MARRSPSPQKSVPGGPLVAPSRPATPGPDTGRTLLQILQRPNPTMTDYWAGKTHTNTRSETDSFDDVLLDDEHPSVQEWTDFTFPAIELAYGHLLSQKMRALEANYRDPLTPSPGQRIGDIVNETSVDAFGIDWPRQIVRAPIRAGGRLLRPVVAPNASPSTEAALFHQCIEWVVRGSKKRSKLKPDWAIIDNAIRVEYPQSGDTASKPLTYVVGDSKLSQKWKSEWLSMPHDSTVKMDPSLAMKAPPTKAIKTQRVLPLEQVATYCRYAETRYAFILTQRELVALRIRRIPQPNADRPGKLSAAIEYAPVLLTANTNLTANLALWALACMGMNDEHRKMETAEHGSLDAMARLTWWTYDATHKVYQNVISKRKIPEAQWKPHYNAFVQLTKDTGNSPTKKFLKVSPALPSISAVAQQMEAMNLGKSSRSSPPPTEAPKSNQDRTTTPRSKPPSPPPPQKPGPSPIQPAAAHTADAAATKPATKPAVNPAANSGANPAANPGAKSAAKPVGKPASDSSKTSAAASASTPPNTKQVFIDNQPFKASYRQSTGNWAVKYMGEELDIVRRGRASVIVRGNGTEVRVSGV